MCPHGWEARVLFEETSRTLLCGDLFAHIGNCPAVITDDLVAPALRGRGSVPPDVARTSHCVVDPKLADLAPRKLAVMHGSSFEGDGAAALRNLAGHYDERLRQALSVGAAPGAAYRPTTPKRD